jgi:hypothetical protein
MPSQGNSSAKWGIIISVISLLISLFTLYISTLRGAQIMARAGDMVAVSISPDDNNFELLTSLVYSNTGARPGVVSAVSLACDGPSLRNQEGNPNLYPVYLASLNPKDGHSEINGIIGPEVVKGGKQITRQILFLSKVDQLPDQVISAGVYVCRLFGRIDNEESLIEFDRFRFTVSETDASVIKGCPVGNRYVYTDKAHVGVEILRLLGNSKCADGGKT